MARLDPETIDALNGEPTRRPLIGIALLPSAATLGNLLCGVVAILCCMMSMRHPVFEVDLLPRYKHLSSLIPSYVAIGSYLLVLAMIFDALDGRLARMARRTSEFGAQLDSIADIVSFGVAPTLLFLAILIRPGIDQDATPVSNAQWRISLVCAMVFVSCAAIRLARYNAENVKDESAQRKFSGLPSPAAAGAFAALLLLHEDLIQPPGAVEFGIDWARLLLWAIAPAIFGLGLLMVSRLNYVHVVNRYLKRDQPLFYLIGLVILGMLLWLYPQIMLVIIAYSYVLSGIVASLGRKNPQAPASFSADESLSDDEH